MHAMNRRIALALLLLGASGVARADNGEDNTLPKFDVEKHCTRAMQGTWSLTRTHAGCVHAEQQAYDALKTSWTSLAEQTRVFCGKVSRTVDNSYSTLQDCVKSESQSDDYEAHLQAMTQHSSAFRQAAPAR
jgi:hypothetical protein